MTGNKIDLLTCLLHSIQTFPHRNALCINDHFYTYSELSYKVQAVVDYLNFMSINNQIIGILATDDISTYANILGVLFTKNGFVPLKPRNPVIRNLNIIEQTKIKIILSNTNNRIVHQYFENQDTILVETDQLPLSNDKLSFPSILQNDIKCILFTSGSTGDPKGVPMTYKNINSSLEAYFNLGYKLNEEDKYLQMFDFNFDMSLLSYLPAFIIGACVYTVPESQIKYLAAIEIMEKYGITFSTMVPSTLSFLRDYFPEILLNSVKYSVFGGEPLYLEIIKEWAKCVPNAQIVNISGPTEITMACMSYHVNTNWDLNKVRNGILAFGKPWKNTTAIIVDNEYNILPYNEIGELCFAGDHVMEGYWNNPSMNMNVFFRKYYNGNERIFYRTGDMAFVDEEGDFMTCGRKDFQYKIQGYKVEIAEIEYHAKEIAQNSNVVAIVKVDQRNISRLFLFVEQVSLDKDVFMQKLRKKLPSYMVPEKIILVDTLPVNQNGKIDRNNLSNQIILSNE